MGVGGTNPGWQPSQNMIWVMQSVGLGLTMINTDLAAVIHHTGLSVLIQAAICSYLGYVQHLGNQSVSNDQAAAENLRRAVGKGQ